MRSGAPAVWIVVLLGIHMASLAISISAAIGVMTHESRGKSLEEIERYVGGR